MIGNLKYNVFRSLNQKNAFTFLEIILSLALLSILTAVFGMGLVAAMESYAFSRSNAELTQKGQLAMQRINRELCELVDVRAAGSDPSFIIYERIEGDASGLPVKTTMGIYCDLANNIIQLYRNISDGIVQLPVEEGTGGEGENQVNTLINGVQSFSLSYFNGNNNWDINVNTMAQLSTLRVSLALERPDNTALSQPFTSLVHLRNTKNAGGAVVY